MAKFKTKGLVLKFGASNPPTATVGQLGDGSIDFGEREGLLDVTTHDNTTGVSEMLDNGFKTPMSCDAELLLDTSDTNHEAIRAAQESGAVNYIQLVIPDTGQATLTAAVRVKSFSVPVPVKGKLSSNISFEGLSATTYVQ